MNRSHPRWTALALQSILVMAAQQATAALPAQPLKPTSSALDQRDIRAQLSPLRYTTLAAEFGAKVDRLPVAEGGAFRAGATLISFDCSMQQAQLIKAKAALSAAEIAWKANQRLNELNSVGKVELDVSAAESAKARAEVAAGTTLMSKCRVTAPFSGRVAEQKVREQQYVQAGQPILDILDDSVLELQFIVPSGWLAWLKPGQTFQVAIDETGKHYPAKVKGIGARVDSVSQSIKVNAVIDGRFSELVAGMSGKILLAPPANR
ncbi:efflux RND transporter periplasmic adaptor subunit [Massilia phyllosphaerae]|uniref:efflux RND transporter periplasmic adaptor subunit n=1 Tax=Massilia phyllosphaerae TaxID=3106034 RepID=UPI002B1CAD62|nr:efflux RND transporter periplasmic adaptor subunit [Massilia sp. SGZ-792]